MKSGFWIIVFIAASVGVQLSLAQASSLLESVEKKYKEAPSVTMEVSKTLKLKLLEQEKNSTGTITLGKGGRFRWETTEPDHSLVLADGKNLWLVDYPPEEGEKPNIIKTANPKHSQPHAVVAFLLSEGRLSDDFLVKKEESVEKNLERINLKPKNKTSSIHWLTLLINKDENSINDISFEDTVGNITSLHFTKIRFDQKIDNTRFKFKVPQNSDVTTLN